MIILNVSILSVLYSILIQILLSNPVRSESQKSIGNETDHAFNLRRSKRAPTKKLLQNLKIRIEYPTGEQVTFKWTLVEQYLANENLPVIVPFGYPNQNVMKDIGLFKMYHDLEKCSAVVYFEKTQSIYGVIGLNYFIISLPFDFNENGEYNLDLVGEPYIQKYENPPNHIHPDNVLPPLSDNDAWKYFFPSFNTNQPFKRKAEDHPNLNPKKNPNACHSSDVINAKKKTTTPVFERYYSETLVFVTHEIAQIFEQYYGEEHYIEYIVVYYIIYFNAVDMLFRKSWNLHGTIVVNIAKIVIEDDLIPFGFIAQDGELQFSEVISKLPAYLEAYSDEYPPDSFDHVFVHTNHTIMDDFIAVKGLSKHGDDLYEARKMNRFYDVVPITVASFYFSLRNYEVAVHEMGRVYNMKIDSPKEGLNFQGQCYGIMQVDGPKCDNCLKWSEENIKQLGNYLSSNTNRCFLLNSPRSLNPPTTKTKLSAHLQCRCFGYFRYSTYANGKRKTRIGTHACEHPLLCENSQYEIGISTVRPFDGTICAHRKVCWNRKCVKLYEPDHQTVTFQ